MADFLLEIGTEEIPPGYPAPAVGDLKKRLGGALVDAGLLSKSEVEAGSGGNQCALYSPRRIAVFVAGLADKQPDRTREVLGPPADRAFDADGKPTEVALGFARSRGVSPEDLVVKETKRGRCCAATVTEKGKTAREVLAGILPGIIAGMSFPKSMWWGINAPPTGKLRFARPIRRIVALLDSDTVEFSIGPLKSGSRTAGHFFASPDEIEIPRADIDAYRRLLEERHVIVDQERRRELLLERTETFLSGASLSDVRGLMDKVVNLVEYPNVLEGRFDKRFLGLPAEVVEEILVSNQKYFPVRKDGVLQDRFLAVFDRPDGVDVNTIRRNCERVVEARLEDGAFFLRQDRRIPFRDRAADLKNQVFHEKLGDYLQKAGRLVDMSAFIAGELDLSKPDAEKAREAAKYCKADLVTTMVTEFPGLQGVIGGIYAAEDGMDSGAAQAIREHYMPCPESLAGKVLSLADAFDNIVGYFSVGEEPTSAGDAHGLRRQALGAAQCILALGEDRKITKRLLLSSMIQKAAELHGLTETQYRAKEVDEFMSGRLYNYFLERDYPAIIIRAAMASGFDDIYDLRARLDALLDLSKDAGWEGLAELVERTYKIGRDADLTGGVNEKLFEEDQEKEVWRILNEIRPKIESFFGEGRYVEGSHLYHRALAAPVHKFFDDVFVNVENEDVRLNRMLLMKEVFDLYARSVADLSLIASGK